MQCKLDHAITNDAHYYCITLTDAAILASIDKPSHPNIISYSGTPNLGQEGPEHCGRTMCI